MYERSRRQFLRGALVAGVAGLAGCGGEATPADGDSPTPAPTATPGDPFCAPITGTPTAADTSGTPFVFTYDYLDSWTVEAAFGNAVSRAQRVVSPTLSGDDGDSHATVRVAQSLTPVTAAEAAETIDFLRENETNNGVTYETEFNGESVEFVEFPNVSVYNYNTHLPYGDGEARYYSFAIVTLLDGGGPGRTISQCTDTVNTATRTTLESIAPNPETTIDER